MLNMQLILQQLQLGSQAITASVINSLIKENLSVQTEMSRKYNSYKAQGLAIASRQATGTNKANNMLINDYRGEIVDQVVGYLFGNPVTYSLKIPEDMTAEDPTYKKNIQQLKDFNRYNRVDALDVETGKMMSVCGRAARLLYIDREGKERVMDVPPWECIFVYDQSLDEVQYALRYYNVYEMLNGQMFSKIRVEWYDDRNVSYWISAEQGYIPDYSQAIIPGAEFTPTNELPHMFERVPLLDFPNNKELLSDFEKTESLIDGYDRLLSDAQNEIEDLRQAYLIFKGTTPDEKTILAAKKSGAFGCDKDDSIEYLTKQLNDAFVEHQKQSLRENIYRFSKTVDVSADTFTGSGASGEARKWLLLALENRGSMKERKFKAGIDKMFRIIATTWKKKGIVIDPQDIEVELDRNLPVELKLEAEIQSTLNGVISDRTRLKLFSAVKDVDEEMAQMKEEADSKVNLDNVPLGNEDPNAPMNPDGTPMDTNKMMDAGAGAQKPPVPEAKGKG